MYAPESRFILDRSFFKFVLVGGVNTFTGLSIIYISKLFLNFGDVLANAVGYSIGISLSFLLNKHWTFCHRGDAIPSLARFLLVTVIAYAANLTIVLYCIEALRLNTYVSQALGVIPYISIGYLGSRFFAFKHSRDEIAGNL